VISTTELLLIFEILAIRSAALPAEHGQAGTWAAPLEAARFPCPLVFHSM
jgi:hypothetical protein